MPGEHAKPERSAGRLLVFYTLLKVLVGTFFNMLNLLLAGNLPPFACVCVVVAEQDQCLVIERPEGGYVFPGGFMRWREHPEKTVEREGREETGLTLRVVSLMGVSSTLSRHFSKMSTQTLVFKAEVAGGELKSSIEGRACWRTIDELPGILQQQQRGELEHFLRWLSEDRREAD
jgi:ADP-ribose pyrophosphatase YjhB (NUDIX family)